MNPQTEHEIEAAIAADGDTVEGEVREEEAVPERGLVRAPVQTSVIVGGTAALAAMSEAEFDENLKALGLIRQRIDKVKLNLMKQGVDYGPPFRGSTKDTLLKPGTETLLRAFGLADSYIIDRHVGHEDEPELDIVAHARIHIGDTSGPVIAEGIGEANTWEVKHRRRKGERLCPVCHQPTVIKGKAEYGGGWLCYRAKGGCGAKWDDGAEAIEGQSMESVDNPDPWDLANTIVKMAKKRALVDGVLTATGSSGLFSQDEDAPGGSGNGRQQPPAGASQPAGQSGAPASSPTGNAAPGASTEGNDDPLPAGVIQAVVAEAPEGIRVSKSERWEGFRPKLELKTKVGNRKHTGMVTGPLAEAAAMADIKPGEVVRFIGAFVHDHPWEDKDGKKMPAMKQVWGLEENKWYMTDLQVMRNSQWWSVNTAMPTLLPTSDASSEAPTSSPSSANAESSEPEPSSGAQPTSSPAPSPGAAPGNPADPPARMKGTPGEWITLLGKLLDPIQFTMKGETPVAILRVADGATGSIVMAAVGEDIEGNVGTIDKPFIKAGQPIQLYGEWTATGWLVVSAVGRPT